MSWQDGGENSLPVAALASNVLCNRHNDALSPLDVLAGELFAVLRDYQADLRASEDPHGPEFALFSGCQFERWMLKLFWGSTASGVLHCESGRITALPRQVEPAQLAAYLFRGAPIPAGMGLFVTSLPGAAFQPKAEVDLSGIAVDGNTIWEGAAAFGPVSFHFAFGLPLFGGGNRQKWHPEAVFMQGEDQRPPEFQKILALGWPQRSSKPIIISRLGGDPSDLEPPQAL